MASVPNNPSDVSAVTQASAAPVTTAVGVSGLRQFNGYIREEFLQNLTGIRGKKIFEEMALNDATCGAILFTIKNMLTSLKWTVVPSDSEDPEAVDYAEMVECMLFDDMTHPWSDFIESCCSMFTYGFAVHEVLWKQRKGPNLAKPWMASSFDDGYWAPQTFALRSQMTIERWVYDEEEHLLGFVQYPYTSASVTVPIARCLHFRTSAENNNPEGRSLLRTAYRSWYWLKRLQEIEGIGTERDLAGYPVLRVPGNMLGANATQEQMGARAAYEDLLRKIRRDQNEGVLLPSDRDDKGNLYYEFELMSSGGTRQLKIDESITRYEKGIARSVLADFTFLGSDGSGSLALGKAKIQVFVEVLKSYSKAIASEINERIVPMIWDKNGFDPDMKPMLQPGEIDRPDLTELGTYLTSLATAGYDVANDKELQDHMRALADFPPSPEEDIEPPAEPPVDPATGKPSTTQVDPNADPTNPSSGLPDGSS